jgi:hypothetical protein
MSRIHFRKFEGPYRCEDGRSGEMGDYPDHTIASSDCKSLEAVVKILGQIFQKDMSALRFQLAALLSTVNTA